MNQPNHKRFYFCFTSHRATTDSSVKYLNLFRSYFVQMEYEHCSLRIVKAIERFEWNQLRHDEGKLHNLRKRQEPVQKSSST